MKTRGLLLFMMAAGLAWLGYLFLKSGPNPSPSGTSFDQGSSLSRTSKSQRTDSGDLGDSFLDLKRDPSDERAIATYRQTLLETKLEKMQVDAQSFEDAPTWLTDYIDVPIVLDRAQITKFGPQALEVPITLDLMNVPADQVLRFISSLSGVPHKITAKGVVFTLDEPIKPPTPPNPHLFTKTYRRPEHLPKPKPGEDLKELLSHHGLSFPEEASVLYHELRDQYIIRNTAEEMKRVDALIKGLPGGRDPKTQ